MMTGVLEICLDLKAKRSENDQTWNKATEGAYDGLWTWGLCCFDDTTVVFLFCKVMM
jgi:hypothetical protein